MSHDATLAELDCADTPTLIAMIASMHTDARLLWSDGYQREALGLMERAGRIERYLRRHRRHECPLR